MPDVSLTFKELVAVEEAIRLVASIPPRVLQGQGDPDARRSALRKLHKALKPLICSHCGSRPHRRRTGLCDRCHVYREKYQRLPSEDTIVASATRLLNRTKGNAP